MLKRLKSVSTLLFLMGVSTGTAYAVAESGITDVKITQQNGSCTGIVKDTTGETVIGASVVVKGTTNGTITGIDGDFSLNNVKQGDIIQISFVGYKTVEVKWNGQPLNVTLKDDTEMLGEVVVTGYGGQQLRTKVTNSISKVKQESLNVGMHSNPAQALSGAVAGLKVIQSSGSPGATPTIILRGGTNLDGTGSPLVVVDGQLRDSMSDINPEDIESMDVLKDAGATALYGARASNGVILITTKRGKAGFREINFKAKLGLSYARTPYEFLEAGEYIKAMRKAHWDAGHLFQDKDGNTKTYWGNWESYLNGKQPFGTGNNLDQDIYSTQFLNEDNKYLLGRGWQTVTDPITGKEILYKNTDVDKYNLNDPAFSQDYNINMSGGNDRGTYYAGLGYNRQEGVPVNTFYERYSFITNASYKIADWLTSTSSLNYNRANWKNMPGSNGSELNYFGRVRSLPPTVLFEDEEGNMKLGPGTADGNQMYQPDQWWNDNQSDKFTMSQSFKIDILKNLSLTANMNWYYSETYQESFTKDYENTPGNFVRTRSATAYYNRDFRQTYNAVLNYNETFFLDHHVEVMLGMEYYNKYQRGFEAQGQGAPTDDLPDLSLTDKGEGKRTINSWHEKQRILSFFGRLNYDFKDKYLLSFVFRRDGYSSLLGDNRWGFFPGVSAGWIFGREDFIKEAIPVMSFGKLRASYGINGNASGIGAYTLQGSYGSSNSNGSFNYNGNTSYLITELPNPNLRWEKTATFEVGADLSFFANRLNTNLTYYNRLTSDKYAALSFPTSTGFSSVTNNNGEFRNQGIEIELSGKIIDSKDWTWSASGNIAFNKNKIVSLPDNGMERNRINAFQVYTGNGDEKKWVGGQQEGQEPGILYLYQADGIYRSYDEIPANLVRKYGSRTYYGPEAWNKLTAEQQNATTNFPIQPVLYLLRKGLEPKMAFDIMEAVRKGKVAKGGFKDGWEEAMREHEVPDWYIESCRKIKYMFPKAHAVAYLMSAIRLMWFKIYRPPEFYAVYFTVRGDDIDYEAAVGGAAVARAHMEEVKRRLKEEKNAKDEDVLVSLQLVNEMLVRGYEFLPIELGKSRGSKYVVEDGKVRLPFSSLKGLGGAAADALEKVTIHGEEYISVEELQQASGVGSSILDRLRQVGALGDLPESSQVSFF